MNTFLLALAALTALTAALSTQSKPLSTPRYGHRAKRARSF